MGQQQLLLLVLATVIVGLATVAGIQAFEQGQTRANQDALTSTAVKIASDVQARVKEPSQFGGYDGNIGTATGSINLKELGYETNGSGKYIAADGDCFFVTGSANDKSFDTTPSSGFSYSSSFPSSPPIEVGCESDQNVVKAGIAGTKPDSIQTAAATIQ